MSTQNERLQASYRGSREIAGEQVVHAAASAEGVTNCHELAKRFEAHRAHDAQFLARHGENELSPQQYADWKRSGGKPITAEQIELLEASRTRGYETVAQARTRVALAVKLAGPGAPFSVVRAKAEELRK